DNSIRHDFRLPVGVAAMNVVVGALGVGRGGAIPAPVRAQAPAPPPPPMAAPAGAVLGGVLGGVLQQPLGELVAGNFDKGIQAGQFVEVDRLDKKERAINAKPANIVSVREYAHTLLPNWTEGSRTDFAETVYWNAGIKTDAKGIANVSFNLSDSVT